MAIAALQRHPRVDRARVFVLGHSLGGTVAPRVAEADPSITAKARMVDSPDLSASTPVSELPLGAPGAYWLDIRGYDPAALAATLGKPMLILQGGRDYQVTVEDDLARWKAALDGRPGVTIRIYPDFNHLFVAGSGPSTPAEYEPAQHVDGAVIDDVADWLRTITPSR
jgi:uncharacterized protein